MCSNWNMMHLTNYVFSKEDFRKHTLLQTPEILKLLLVLWDTDSQHCSLKYLRLICKVWNKSIALCYSFGNHCVQYLISNKYIYTLNTFTVTILTSSVSSLRNFWKCLLMLQFSLKHHGFIYKVPPWAIACIKRRCLLWTTMLLSRSLQISVSNL